jgi:hypothetical protein
VLRLHKSTTTPPRASDTALGGQAVAACVCSGPPSNDIVIPEISVARSLEVDPSRYVCSFVRVPVAAVSARLRCEIRYVGCVR